MNAHTRPNHDSLPIVPPLSRILEHFFSPDPPIFGIGDSITFEKADGYRGVITILGYSPTGEVECMFFNGRGHHVNVSLDNICGLRVLRVETMRPEDINMYRRLLGLDPQEADLEDAA